MRKIVLRDDNIKQLQGMGIGDTIVLMKHFRFSGENSYNATEHLERNMPLASRLWVAEDIGWFQKDLEDSGLSGFPQLGYMAETNKYLEKNHVFTGKAYSASKMPKKLSRFELCVLSHGKILNDSTSWFSTAIVYQLLFKRDVLR